MSALQADRITTSKGPLRRQVYPVAADAVIYAGAMVCLSATGYAVPAANTAGLSDVVGVSTAAVDATDLDDGDVKVVVEYGGAFLIDVGGGITQADAGRDAYVTDDQTLTDAAAASNKVCAGRILEFVDEAQNKAWVNIMNATGASIPDGTVITADLADDSVTAAKAPVFVSTEQTGTGSAQNVAHGLGATPSVVLVIPTEHPGTPDTGAFDIAEGSHGSTNVVVTVTLNVKFKVFAWA